MTDVPVPASGRDLPPLAGGGGFAIEVRHVFDHPPVRTFRIFVDRINEWWDQRLHPEARTVLEAAPGGDFKQLWSSGGAFLATVAQVDAPYRLRLVGPLAIARPAHSVVEITFEPTPDGHYTDESMKATVVPNRNMLFLAVAASWAIAQGAAAVAYAAHAGDHAIYPDCRPEFVRAMSAALGLADWRQLELATPFINWDKGQIVRRGAELGVPFEKTWSCYRGGTAHCGTCGTCVERREAFSQAGIADPTIYELYE